MAQEGGQGGAGGHPEQARPVQTHLQGIGQLHGQGRPGGGDGPEQGVLVPAGLPEGGEDRVHQYQDTAAAQGRAKGQKDECARRRSAEDGQGAFSWAAGGQKPRRQRGAAIQAAAGGQETRRGIARQAGQQGLIWPC